MAKTRQQKEQDVEVLADQLKKMKGAVLVDYKGLSTKNSREIRKNTWQGAIDYAVVKKTLLGLALKQAGLGEVIDAKTLHGNIGIVIGSEDEVNTSKFAAKYANDYEAFNILGGVFEGAYVGGDKVKALATLPSRLELLARVVGSIQAPVSGFVRVLSGNLRGLVQVLNSIRESKIS